MSQFVRDTVAKFSVPVAFALCLSLSATVLLDYVLVGKFANDFGVYWRTANNPVEQAYFWPGRFPFPYAPTMLLWISPLAFAAKWPAYFLWGAVSTAAFVLAVRPYLTKRAIALCLVSPPLVRGIFTGQVSTALGALMIWACGTGNRIAAGIAFGVIASIKPQLVIMAPLMLALNRDWRAFIAAGATFVAAVLLATVIFGADRWSEWIGSMGHFYHAVTGTSVIDIGMTPAVIAERLGLPPLPFLLLGTMAGAVIVYLCRSMEPLERAAAITLGSLLASPYALAYDLVAIVPLLALAVFHGRIGAGFGVAVVFPPVPLLVAAYELIRLAPSKNPDRAAREVARC